MNSKIINSIYKFVNQHQPLFNSFVNVYLFGSILTLEKNPNDIDILLIYSDYSNEIINNLDAICSRWGDMSGLSIDLTVLSLKEENETKFIRRLNSNYIRIK